MESRRPIDVLTDRSAKTLRIWLQTLLDIEIMCRDRAGPYSGGVASGAPVGFQVADRWHIWENLGDALERAIAPRRHCLTAAAGCLDDAPRNYPISPRSPQACIVVRSSQVCAKTGSRSDASSVSPRSRNQSSTSSSPIS
ncbi:transposase [Nocardia coubleae]|uniref:Transposase n=2 Tax=Nocardia coubleae TaxID=356147 RepID=A0A846WG60_9NOCA|nr:transposase [Nocardia coubleae]